MIPRIQRSQFAASIAAAGTNAATAAILVGGKAVYPVTAADGTKGVILAAVDAVLGNEIKIGNRAAAAVLKIYPPTGGTINGASANAAFDTTSGQGITLICMAAASGGTWITV